MSKHNMRSVRTASYYEMLERLKSAAAQYETARRKTVIALRLAYISIAISAATVIYNILGGDFIP